MEVDSEHQQSLVPARCVADRDDHDRQPAVCVDALRRAAAEADRLGSCPTFKARSRCSSCFRPGCSRSMAGWSIGSDLVVHHRSGCAVRRRLGGDGIRDVAADALRAVLRCRYRRRVRLQRLDRFGAEVVQGEARARFRHHGGRLRRRHGALHPCHLSRCIASRGYQATFVATGIFQGLVILLVAQFLQPSSCAAGAPAPAHAAGASRSASGTSRPLEMLSTPQFYWMYAVFVLMATGGLLVTANAGPIAKSWGFSAGVLTLAATLSPLANGGSRVFWGWASDRLGRETTMVLTFVLQAACLASVVTLGQLSGAWFAATLVAVYFTWGEIYSLFPSMSGDYFGTRYATSNYGVIYTAKGVASIIGPWVGARIFEQTGSWAMWLLRQRGDGARRGRHRCLPPRRITISPRQGESNSGHCIESECCGGHRRPRRRAHERVRDENDPARPVVFARGGVRPCSGLRNRSRARAPASCGRPGRLSAARWASRTRRCGESSNSTRWSGRTCTTTR